MKKLLSLFVLAGVFFFNTGLIHAQDETVSEEVAQEALEEVMTEDTAMVERNQLQEVLLKN